MICVEISTELMCTNAIMSTPYVLYSLQLTIDSSVKIYYQDPAEHSLIYLSYINNLLLVQILQIVYALKRMAILLRTLLTYHLVSLSVQKVEDHLSWREGK